MHRIRISRPGGYEALQWVEAPDLTPGPGEVIIATEAAGVNYADGIIRMGLYASAKDLHGYPITPGFEVAGRVAALGEGVEGLQVGDEVVGVTLFNGYATQVRLLAQGVFPKPPGLAMAEAATLPTVFLTAWWMVHRQVHPRPGDRWLVHSAAGGVGSALLQLARLAQAETVGVVGRTHKVAYAHGMGAGAVVDKSREPLWPSVERLAPEGFDAVFDANGIATLAESYRHLAPTGKLVVYGFHTMLPQDGRLNWFSLVWNWLRTPRFNPLKMTGHNRSVMAANLSYLQARAPDLREGMLWLLERFTSGALTPLPVETYPMDRAAEAQRRIESGETVGKLALIPPPGLP
jgi:NADPH:quinone reductase-like Zn-dependent oxidoreductase